MNIKELAERLNGTRELAIHDEIGNIADELKRDGIVVVTGYSDDNVEFFGAISDEVGCYSGGVVLVTPQGELLQEHAEDWCCDAAEREFKRLKETAKPILAKWCREYSRPGVPIAWTFETEIPHVPFDILDEDSDDVWCRGIIFRLEALKQPQEVVSMAEGMIENVARLCHETNRAYCEICGDHSQVPWANAPDNIKQSAIDGVKFHLDNPNAGPAGSHENWLKFKEADGWRYGFNKDSEQKTHPCIVPYNQLSREQRVKDYLFVAIVKAMEHFA